VGSGDVIFEGQGKEACNENLAKARLEVEKGGGKEREYFLGGVEGVSEGDSRGRAVTEGKRVSC